MHAQTYFLGDTGPRTQLLIVPASRSRARRVDSYAMFPQESEVLLALCTRLRVLSCCRDLHGSTQIQLQEVEPTDPIFLFSEPFKIGGDSEDGSGDGGGLLHLFSRCLPILAGCFGSVRFDSHAAISPIRDTNSTARRILEELQV